MIAYLMVGTNDLPKAAAFYDALMPFLKPVHTQVFERSMFYEFANKHRFIVTKPYNGEAATVGNGSMVALACETPEIVDAMYAKAIELGAQCEGKPGDRFGMGYFAYFRDMDGNKVCAACPNF